MQKSIMIVGKDRNTHVSYCLWLCRSLRIFCKIAADILDVLSMSFLCLLLSVGFQSFVIFPVDRVVGSFSFRVVSLFFLPVFYPWM